MTKVKLEKKQLSKRILVLLSLIGVISVFIFGLIRLDRAIPNNIKLTLNEDEEFSFDLPMEGEINSSTGVLNINNEKVPRKDIKLDLR